MIVVRIEEWPDGDHRRAQSVGVATLRPRVEHNGERSYDVNLFKLPQYGGLDVGVGDIGDGVAASLKQGAVGHLWKRAPVRGHFFGRLEVFDLVGGVLRVLLGDRLGSYRAVLNRPREPQP